MANKLYGGVSGAGANLVTDLYGGSNSGAQRITKLYGSANGQTKLIHQGFGHLDYRFGELTYYIDNEHMTTNTIQLTTQEEINSLCNISTTWTASIKGATIPNTNIKEVYLTSKVNALNNGFLRGCSALDTIDVSNATFTDTGWYFLTNCTSFNDTLELPSGLITIGSFSMGYMSSLNNAVILPQTLTTIGAGSFSYNTSFNTQFYIPSSVTTIGIDFFAGNTVFNQPLSLPSSLTNLGGDFLYNCKSMTSEINVGSLAANIASSSDNSFSTNDASANCYINGMNIAGANRAAWISRFPNRTSSPYRKLVNAGH